MHLLVSLDLANAARAALRKIFREKIERHSALKGELNCVQLSSESVQKNRLSALQRRNNAGCAFLDLVFLAETFLKNHEKSFFFLWFSLENVDFVDNGSDLSLFVMHLLLTLACDAA